MNIAFNEISDFSVYNTRMEKGMMDKLFFVDKIEANTIFDFGCANGSLIEYASAWLPDVDFVGYDNCPNMIEEAADKLSVLPNASRRFYFGSDWETIIKHVEICRNNKKKTALILSSIIHEIYHYQEPKEIDQIWNNIFNTGFDFIVIRDMIPSRSLDRMADINDVAKIYNQFLHTQQLQDFTNNFGSVENNRNLVHFLLKYKYQHPNWAREVKENYLPIYREDLLAMIPKEYQISYHEHYVLPYIRRTVFRDLGITLKDPTHLKLILELS